MNEDALRHRIRVHLANRYHYSHSDFCTKLEGILAEHSIAQPAQVPAELSLNIIRKWPDGFQKRLDHVWKDVDGFIPNVKLYDLQRTLAEFGFTMKVYEQAAQPAQVPATCAWNLIGDEWDGVWESSCGELWSFIDGGPQDNRVSYCHNCGKKVELPAAPEVK